MLSTDMSWEVVQDFLNVSGIKGVALIDGQSRPYFRDIEKILNAQQREALAQGVWQVLETIPESFESFEFQFSGTQVYIHKMAQGLILLILTHDTLIYPDYCEAFTRLKASFEADSSATLEAFRRLLGARNTTAAPLDTSAFAPMAEVKAAPPSPRDPARPVPAERQVAQAMVQSIAEQNGNGGAAFATVAAIPAESPPTLTPPNPDPKPTARRRNPEDTLPDLFPDDDTASATAPSAAKRSTAAPQAIAQSKTQPSPQLSPQPSLQVKPQSVPPSVQPLSPSPPAVVPPPVPPEPVLPSIGELTPSPAPSPAPGIAPDIAPGPTSSLGTISLETWLNTLNTLGQAAVHYLGRAVVANYWRTTRPPADWLASFEIERSGNIQSDPQISLSQSISATQQADLQTWAQQFIQRCGRVIRDFPQLAQTQGLTPEQLELLDL